MCAIPKNQQPATIYKLQTHPLIRMNGPKIVIADCAELIKTVTFAKRKR